jgi:hypothetical protein
MTVDQAISTLSQSDPIVKLLQEVKLGRMKPTDAGLRTIAEAWLETYQKILGTPGFDRDSLMRLDPAPRLEVLIAAGVLSPDDAMVLSLRTAFQEALKTSQ